MKWIEDLKVGDEVGVCRKGLSEPVDTMIVVWLNENCLEVQPMCGGSIGDCIYSLATGKCIRDSALSYLIKIVKTTGTVIDLGTVK